MFVIARGAAIRLPEIPIVVAASLAAVLAAVPGLAWAHSDVGRGSGFLAGLQHPLTGPDHMLAMLAVGMWGTQLKGDAIWALPVAFPLIMALGAVAGISAMQMAPIEPGIALSVVALGAVIAMRVRPPLAVAIALIGVFAIFHGYAHGRKLPQRADALAYCVGFVLATRLVHLRGIGIGQVERLARGAVLLRAAGAVAWAGFVLAGHLPL
jgi:urease accessory protein